MASWRQRANADPADVICTPLKLVIDELTKDRFLIGSPDEIAEQIVGYHNRLGVNNICLGAQGVGMPQSQLLEAIQLFSEEVMPRVEQAL